MGVNASARYRLDMKRLRAVLDLLTTVLVLVAATVVIALAVRNWRQAPIETVRQAPGPELPKTPLPIHGVETIGRTSAPLAMMIYSDFQCPYCGQFARETWPSIKKNFVDTGRVLVIFRNLPLAIHQEAKGAAVSAECAARQGKFWAVHDLLFQNQLQLGPQTIRTIASSAGMDLNQFDQCMQDKPDETIARDVQSAQTLGINGTPTFLIGRIQADRTVKVSEVIRGAQPEGRFKTAFDNAATNSVSE